jgi:CDP-diacylglycerol--glycerol-3-phosphate 3-phosphatidyltransferase
VAWSTPEPRCGHHGCWDGWTEPLLTWANVVTAVRLVLALALVGASVATGDSRLLLAALACYLVLDMVDGFVARRLRQETRGGALFDVLADRASSMAVWVTWAVTHPDVVAPVLVYTLEFVVVDGLLSTLWLAWPLLSCNHVARVDPVVYRLNWSTPAKAANSGCLLLLVLLWPQPVLAVIGVGGILVVKVYSLLRLHALLPAPQPGCAYRVVPSIRTKSPAS